jgi:hypothetical protein
VRERLLQPLLGALARTSGWLARALRRVARQLEAIEAAGTRRLPELLPEDLVFESEPPPIPADACRRPLPLERDASEQERAWQELISGRHPHRLTRLSAPALSGATSVRS